jgi:hypothetical protein
MSLEHLVEWLAGDTEALGEILSQYHFVYHKSHIISAELEHGIQLGNAGD